MTKRRTTAAKLKRAADLAKETGQAVTVGDFTVHPPADAPAHDAEAEEIERRMREQMGGLKR